MAAEGSSSGTLLKQTLMSNNECFVYKIPALATASGYRANDWNLESPLETCGFQVERRNNDLYLLFTLENHTKLFALSKIEGEGTSISNMNVETVQDSSRYFVCKIVQSNPNDATKKTRTALLGFGFRERDIAIDLLGNLQQFRQSIQRELEAKDLASKTKSIPTLADGEKLHVKIPGGGKKKKKSKSFNKGSKGGGPMLLKKPPPGADENNVSEWFRSGEKVSEEVLRSPNTPKSPTKEGKRFSMSTMECPIQSMTIGGGNNSSSAQMTIEEDDASGDGDDNSEAAYADSIIDDLQSVGSDLKGDDNAIEGGGGAAETSGDDDDDQSEGAVGGETIGDDGSADSFEFSALDLDDEDDAGGAKDAAAADVDFGEFQAA